MTIYITSYLRSLDPDVTYSSTYVIFPISVTVGAVFMQVAALLNEYLHPRIQMAFGGSLIGLAYILCSYITNYNLFVMVYSVFIGVSFGILYMVSVKNAW